MHMDKGFPGSSDGKKICLQCRRPRFDPWIRKIPWNRAWQPTPVFLLVLNADFLGDDSSRAGGRTPGTRALNLALKPFSFVGRAQN